MQATKQGQPPISIGPKFSHEAFKNPAWERRWLEIKEANAFKCQSCGASGTYLYAHFCWHEKELFPWEYPASAVRVLCNDCRKIRLRLEMDLKKLMARCSDDWLRKTIDHLEKDFRLEEALLQEDQARREWEAQYANTCECCKPLPPGI